ncbi:MAG: DUF1657 domain-containing protein [Firmicutes bacterium]|nr:DUF1657 domain-containing protein [Bacillota bacterium]
MTVGTKVHQALASLRSLEGQFETFALDTQDQQAKQMYNQCRQQLARISQQLAQRVNYIEQQEPTYKISTTTSAGGAQSKANQGNQSNQGNQQNFSAMTTTTGMTSDGMPTGAASMNPMTNQLSQTTFGTGRSLGSTASTGATGQGNWSSPTNNTGGKKATKKK